MKSTVLAAILMCTTAALAPVRAQAGEEVPDAIRDAVFAAREAVWRARFTNDRAVLERMLPAEFVGLGWGGGAFESRASALAAAAEFATAQGRLLRLEFQDDRLQRFGEVVTVFSNYLVEIELDGEVAIWSGRATGVFVRRDGDWISPAWHLDSGR